MYGQKLQDYNYKVLFLRGGALYNFYIFPPPAMLWLTYALAVLHTPLPYSPA